MEKRVIGVFSVIPQKNDTQIKIDHIDNVTVEDDQQRINDEITKRFDIDIERHVFGEINKCHITDSFLSQNKKLPVYYINIIQERSIRKFLLYRINVMFEIMSDIKSQDDLFNSIHYGMYEISIDAYKENTLLETKENINTDFENLITFIKSDDMMVMTNELIDQVSDDLKKEFEKMWGDDEIPTKVISLKNYKID